MKKVNIQFKFSNRFLYTFISIVIMILVGIMVFAYTGNVGHTSSQIDESDPTVASSVKDGVSWSELSGIPLGFEDGVDNEGISGVSWSQISGIPSGFADGTDNEGSGSVSWSELSGIPSDLGDETDTLQSVTNRGRITTQNIRSPKLEDNDNTGYYVDPNSNSWLYRIYSYDIRSDIFYDRQNTGYYVDPASTSKFNTINLGGVSRSSWPSGVSWNEVSGKPSGFSDNTDNVGITSESDPTVTSSVKDGVSWSEVSGKPSLYSGTLKVEIKKISCPSNYIGGYTDIRFCIGGSCSNYGRTGECTFVDYI